MNILIENSTWNNIGDAFYQSSLYALFKNIYPNSTLFMGEGPMKRAFRPKIKWQLNNGFRLMDYQYADLHIFSGPILRKFLTFYSDKVKNILKNGGSYALISVSSAHITEQELQETGNFFEKYPPLILSSRDNETYNNFKKFNINTYNGICTAFLVNKMLPVVDFGKSMPFFVSSFYQELEPYYRVNGDVKIENIIVDRKKTYFNLSHNYSRHLNFFRPQQEKIDTHSIVRVHQDLSTHFYHIKFSHPNSFMSFNPLSYLSVYKSADFTISDRVHSCAVSLAFGKPAILYTNSPRAGIFERLGYNFNKSGQIIYPINDEIIEGEIENLSKAIKMAI